MIVGFILIFTSQNAYDRFMEARGHLGEWVILLIKMRHMRHFIFCVWPVQRPLKTSHVVFGKRGLHIDWVTGNRVTGPVL